jgi:hypothetical protein
MNILLVAPSNLKYSPYVRQYSSILAESDDVVYDISCWDRLPLKYINLVSDLAFQNVRNIYSYQDLKVNSIRRGYFAYKSYSKYIAELLLKNHYDLVIVFTLQLSCTLNLSNYRGVKILDIRDYHWLIKLNSKRIFKKFDEIVISSPGFKTWLPKNRYYHINYNITNQAILESEMYLLKPNKTEIINISYVGLIRDDEIQLDLVSTLSNQKEFLFQYFGRFVKSDSRLIRYADGNFNVSLNGEYDLSQEKEIYKKSHFINLVMSYDNNSSTLLPNRLLNSVVYCRPIITLKGSYTAEIVSEFNLGIIIDISELKVNRLKLSNLVTNFDYNAYLAGRERYLKLIHNNQELFICYLRNLIRRGAK